jgi:hypothetical protein
MNKYTYKLFIQNILNKKIENIFIFRTKSEYKVSLFNDNLFYKNSKGRSRGGAIEKGGLKRSSSMPDVLEELKG